MIAPRHIEARRRQRGFVLLFVFLVAAGIGIMMYMELPRVAFETQRNREELLMERGKQYQRAIGLFLKKYQRYPAKIEDLENTNNLRFLRRRYVDPMTGKDDWRLVHAGPGGILTDSLVKRKTPAAIPGMAGTQVAGAGGQGGPGGAGGNAMAPGGSMNVDPGFTSGTTDPNQPQQVNAAVLRRASDRSLAAGVAGTAAANLGVDPNAPPPFPSQSTAPAAGQTGQPQGAGQLPNQFQQPPAPGQTAQQQATGGQVPNQFQQQPMPGQTGQPGQQQVGQVVPGFAQQPTGVIGEQPPTGVPGTSVPAGIAAARPGTQFNPPSTQFQGGAGTPVAPTGVAGQDQSQQTGTGLSGTGSSFNNNNNPALQAINNQLSGRTGLSAGNNSAFGTGAMGGGIAGVASKFKGPSIKVYDEQQRYEKWEFIYDPKKDSALTKNLPQAQAVANPGNTVSDPAKTQTQP